MHRKRVGWSLPALLILSLATSGGASHAGGEISLLATDVRGDYGTGVDGDARWLTLRYVVGNRLQFRTELPVIRADTLATGITFAGPGPIPTGRNGSGSHAMQPSAAVSGPVVSENSSTSASGVGDVRLAVSGPVFGGGVRLFRIDASVEVKIPTADEDRELGTGEWDYRVGLAGEYRFWSASVFGGLGWNVLGDTPVTEFDDVLDAYVGLDSNPFAGERLIATGWVEGWQAAVGSADHRAAVGLGIRTTGKLHWRLQVRAGLTDSSEDLAVVAGVSYGITPRGPGARGHQR